jgi:hypothetical protein
MAALFEAEHGGAHMVTNLGEYQEERHFHVHMGAG